MIFLLIMLNFFGFSQEENPTIREANKLYNQKKYNDAEVLYKKSLEVNGKSLPAKYNLGNTNYRMENFEGALNTYSEIANNKNLDLKTRSKAYHNLGNSYLSSQKYQEAIDAYKNSLKSNPGDKETIYNLEYAKKQLQNQQNNQNQNDKNQDNKNQENNKDKNNEKNKDNQQNQDQQNDQNKDKQNQNKDQQKNDQSKNDKQNNQDQQKSENGEQKDQQNKDQKGQLADQKQLKISKEDAERMLQALAKQEKQTQLKVRKLEKSKSKIEKNW